MVPCLTGPIPKFSCWRGCTCRTKSHSSPCRCVQQFAAGEITAAQAVERILLQPDVRGRRYVPGQLADYLQPLIFRFVGGTRFRVRPLHSAPLRLPSPPRRNQPRADTTQQSHAFNPFTGPTERRFAANPVQRIGLAYLPFLGWHTLKSAL